MAFMNQDRKKELAPAIKAVLKKYKIKGTVAVQHHSTLVVNIKEGDLDLLSIYDEDRTYAQVNPYWVVRNTEDDYPVISAFYAELIAAMKGPNWFDKSDSMTDYFHVAWYLNINVGDFQRPYIYRGAAQAA